MIGFRSFISSRSRLHSLRITEKASARSGLGVRFSNHRIIKLDFLIIASSPAFTVFSHWNFRAIVVTYVSSRHRFPYYIIFLSFSHVLLVWQVPYIVML